MTFVSSLIETHTSKARPTGSRRTALGPALVLLTVIVPGGPAWAQDAGDAAAGEKVFARCKACHQVGEKARNGVGPQLNGIVGRASAAIADYRYSPAMQKAGLTWDPATLQAFLQNPKAVVPGTKMTMAGLTKEADFSNLLAYLKQFGTTATAP